MSQLILLEFNEINFDFLVPFSSTHPFPDYQRIINNHGLCKTTLERELSLLEHRIQWVTAQTGVDADSPLEFRVGDFADES